MVAGRELDALVQEHIFGWTWVTEDEEQPEQVPFLVSSDGDSGIYYPKVAAEFPDIQPHFLPPRSTSIAAAWEVVAHPRFLPHEISITKTASDDFHCQIVGVLSGTDGERFEAYADTAPHAIALAALAAVGALPTPGDG